MKRGGRSGSEGCCGPTTSSASQPPATSEPKGKVKVRKRRSKTSFVLFIAMFLVVTTFRSTRGGQVSETGQKRTHHASSTQPSKHHGDHGGGHGGHSLVTEESTGDHHGGHETLHPSSHPKHHETEEHLTTEVEEDMEVTTHAEETTHHPSGHSGHSNETKHHEGHEKGKKNESAYYCITPAIDQFPPPLLNQNIRKNGGFLVHIAVAAYTFLALAIICDEFFVPSLDMMCDVLKMQPDVAGATFMAAGSSAPELATALIGVFIAKDDIGVSGVIGSAVFNIMFVISICGLLTPTVLYLNWWPMVRDCFFYMISILALLFCIYDEEIEWYESIILLLLYCLYIYAMYMNTVLEAWANTLPIPFPVHVPVDLPTEKSGLVTYKATGVQGEGTLDPGATTMTGAAYGQSQQSSMDYGAGDEQMGGRDGDLDPPKKVPIPPVSILAQFNPPADSGFKKILWQISLPLIYLFYYTVPDCRIEQWRSWYVVTFSMAMVWIALFSYVMVWMITVVGYTVGIPDTVMGLTFVAAGVSVPDALSSLAVMKEGFGDMAVSNAIGSNVFDILICLGLPWFLSSVIVHPGVSVKVISKGLVYSTLSLLSTVAFLLIATHYNGWQLNKKYGVMLLLWYLLFMVVASLYELNVFGDFNPPECISEY